MKKLIIYILLGVFFATWVSCSKNSNQTATTLIGELGTIEDTLYLYGTDRFYDQLDTIYVKKGQFKHELNVDTTIIAYIYSHKFKERPLFITPNSKITIQQDSADATQLTTIGSQINSEYDLLKRQINSATNEQLDSIISSYISMHPFSMSSIAAIQEHLAWLDNPKYRQVEDLIEKLPGILKDRQPIEEINTHIMRAQRAQVDRSALFFNLPSFKEKNIDKKDFNDKTYILYFWATWDKNSQNLNDSLKVIYKKWKKQKNFDIVGISLDLDTLAIKQTIKRDTLNWKMAYDLDGIESKVADRYGVMKLPTTYLINKHGTIKGRDLPLDSIQSFLEDTFNKRTKY